MDKTLAKTLISAFGVTILVVFCYLYIDRSAAYAALTLKGTGWHEMAKQISLCANHFFYNLLLALGFIFCTFDALKNGLTERSKSVLYVCTVVAAAMLIGDVLKDLFGRARPPLLFDKGVYGFFPLAGDYLHLSFPSGHSLRIFSAMTALGFVLPYLRVPALTLAVLVGVSRVVALKHYPSDVLFGAFIGITAAVWGWRVLYPYGHKKQSS